MSYEEALDLCMETKAKPAAVTQQKTMKMHDLKRTGWHPCTRVVFTSG